MNTIKHGLMNALRTRYEADVQEGLSTLLIYFNNPVAIGEHPQHLEEMNTLLDKMATANDKLEMLSKYNSLLMSNDTAVDVENKSCPYNNNKPPPINTNLPTDNSTNVPNYTAPPPGPPPR